MRIHDFSLHNYRGVRSLSLNALPDTGVIVVSGDNEAGKSTVLEALHNILHVSHGSGAKAIKETQPRGQDVGPEASLHASVGPYRFRLTKRWISKKKCELHIEEPRVQQFTGKEAEDKLAEILAEHVDTNLLGTLFVEQGELSPAFAAAGIPTLTQSLNDASGGESSAQDDTGIMDKVAKEYDRYFQKSGKPNKAYKEIIDTVAAKQQDFEDARRTYDELQSWVSSVENIRAEEERLTEQLPEAKAEHAQASAGLEVATTAKKRVDDAQRDADAAATQLELIKQQMAAREELAEELESAKAKLDNHNESLAAATEAATKEQEQLDAANAEIDKAEAAEKDSRDSVKSARAVVEQVDAAAQLAEFTAIKDSVEKLDKESGEEEQLPEVTAQQVTDVEEATTALTVATKLFEQTATAVVLSATSPTTVGIDGDELTVEEEHTQYLNATTTITTGDLTIEIQPGGSANPGKDVERAQAKLDEVLTELGATDLADVRAKRDAYLEQARSKESREKDRRRILGNRSMEQVLRDIAALTTTLDGVDVDALPSKADAAKAVADAELTATDAQDAVEKLRAQSVALREKPAGQRLTTLQIQAEQLTENIAVLEAKLARHDEAADKEALEKNYAAANTAANEAKEALREATAALGAVDFDTASRIFEATAANVESITNRLRTTEHELMKLDSHITSAEGAAEELEKARVAVAHAQYELDRSDRRARAAKKLYEVLTAHRDAVRRKYSQPFADQLSRLARPVFGQDVSFELNENLQVESRVAHGTEIKVGELSGGAQEQLGIISRFAVAELTGDTPMPVFIDDALGSTDPQRLRVMGSVFSEAGKHSQVFVFTCVPERYNYVAHKQEYRMTNIKS